MSKLLQIAFAVIMLGFLAFYGEADWTNQLWQKAWYIWTDITFILLLICLYSAIKQLLLRRLITILLITYSLRLTWETVYLCSRTIVENHGVIFLMWLITIALIVYITTSTNK